MKFAAFFSIFLSTFMLSATWIIEHPESGQTLMRNENGHFTGSKSILFMVNSNIRLKKTFPLNELPPNVISGAKRCVLRLYCNVADFHWNSKKDKGLNENIAVVINGKRLILKTSAPYFSQKKELDQPQYYRWTDIEFPVEWLKNAKNNLEVEIFKTTPPGGNDYFYPAADIKIPNQHSLASSDGGRTWSKNFGCLKNDNGEFMLRLIIFDGGKSVPGNPGSDFSTDRDICDAKIFLQNGAAKGKQLIAFPGKKNNRILIPRSGDINITEHGLTLSAIMRFREPDANIRTGNDMMIFYKAGAFFLGRTGNRFNFSLCADGKLWSQALIGGEVPAYNEWFHLAAVVRRINEPEQGNVGYQLGIYINGELHIEKFLRYTNPDSSKSQLIIGSGLSGYDFCGDIAEISCFNRAMDQNEIAQIAVNAPRVRHLPAGMFDVEKKLADNLLKLEKYSSRAGAKWLVNALRRAAVTGADENILRQITALTAEELGLTADSDSLMAEKFNAAQKNYRILVSKDALLLLTLGKNKRSWPAVGMFNRHSQLEVFAEKSIEFQITCRDKNGKSKFWHNYSSGLPYEVKLLEENTDSAKWQVTWKNNELKIVSMMTFSGGRLTSDLTVESLLPRQHISELIFPKWNIAGFSRGQDTLLYPRRSGILTPNPTKKFNFNDSYPGAEVPMQFSAYYDRNGNGIYFAYEEPRGLTKEYSLFARNNNIMASWTTRIGYPADPASPALPVVSGNAVTEIYRGEWFEAGQIYKKFVSSQAAWWIKDRPRKDTPQWYMNNPIWFCASATASAARELLYLREYIGLPIAVYWTWWYSFPNHTDSKHTPGASHEEIMQNFKNANINAVGYVNPRLWQFAPGSKAPVNFWINSLAENAAAKSASGEVETENYGTPYPVICPASPEGIKQRVAEYSRLAAESGLSGIYLDQLPCGRERRCFARNHGHLLDDSSTWIINGYWKLMDQTRDACRQVNPGFSFDGEDASEVHLNRLDGFMTWRWNTENHVPLFQSIYGGRVQFTGRSLDAFGGKGGGSWESMFQKVAEELAYGEQISEVHLNDIRYASPRRIYLKKMSHLRWILASFFNESDMLAPIKFSPAQKIHSSHWADGEGSLNVMTLPEIISAAWHNPIRNCRIYIFANPLNKAITIHPVIKLNPGEELFICREGADSVEKIPANAIPSSLPMPPYSTVIGVAGTPETAGIEAARIMPTLTAIAGFTDCGKILEHYTERSKRNKISAAGGKWINVESLSWIRNCYMPLYPTFGWGWDGGKTRWLQAVADGELFWGEVDFGTNAVNKIEIMVAADPERAGGTIGFYDVTKSEEGELIGEITVPVTGDWFDFKTLTIELKNPISGKRDIHTRFRNGGCNIRSWRAL